MVLVPTERIREIVLGSRVPSWMCSAALCLGWWGTMQQKNFCLQQLLDLQWMIPHGIATKAFLSVFNSSVL